MQQHHLKINALTISLQTVDQGKPCPVRPVTFSTLFKCPTISYGDDLLADLAVRCLGLYRLVSPDTVTLAGLSKLPIKTEKPV